MNILTVNLLFSTLVFWIAAKLYILPRLHAVEPRTVLLPILLLHSTRHLGLMFLAPGAVYPGIPPQFAYPAAFGDLLAAALALTAISGGLRAGTECKIPRLAVQHRGHAGPRCRHRARHGLRRGGIHGARLLDSGFLGSSAAGNSLCHFYSSRKALGRRAMTAMTLARNYA